MNSQTITNEMEWNTKIGSFKMSQFLQSWEYGIFNEEIGNKKECIKIEDDYVLFLVKHLPLGMKYMYIPRSYAEIDRDLLDELKHIAKKNKYLFIRLDPIREIMEPQKLGLRKVTNYQPSKTILLDLSKSEQVLLEDMHHKTRYNIRLAEKKGVTCRQGTVEEFDHFWSLISKTYERKGKRTFNKTYYQTLLKQENVHLFFAEYEGKVIVANIVVVFGDTVTYLHGGSDNEYKKLMAPHLLQWFQIQKAKELGAAYYDFWGIDEKYPGVSRFKKGFGGFEVEYPGTYEVPVRKIIYFLYRIVKSILK